MKSEISSEKNIKIETITFVREKVNLFTLLPSANDVLLIRTEGVDARGADSPTMSLGPVSTAKGYVYEIATSNTGGFVFSNDVVIDGGIEVTGKVSLPPGSVGEAMLAADSVTEKKIKSGAVTADKIAEQSIGETRLTSQLQEKIDGALSAKGGEVAGALAVGGAFTARADVTFSGASLNDGKGGMPKLVCSQNGLQIDNGSKEFRVGGAFASEGPVTARGDVAFTGASLNDGKGGMPKLTCSQNGLQIDNGSKELRTTGNIYPGDDIVFEGGTVGDPPKLTCSQHGLQIDNGDKEFKILGDVKMTGSGIDRTPKLDCAMRGLTIDNAESWLSVTGKLSVDGSLEATSGGLLAGLDEHPLKLEGPIEMYGDIRLRGNLYADDNKSNQNDPLGKFWVWDDVHGKWGFLGRLRPDSIGEAYIYASDERLKQNIAPMPGALEQIAGLRPVTFEWNEDAYRKFTAGLENDCRSAEGTPEGDERLWERERRRIREERAGMHRGLIAQELERVFPEWVKEDGEGHKQIDTSELGFVLIKAMQDMRAEYQARIGRLEAQIDALKKGAVRPAA